MGSISERTFGSRIGNAEKLVVALQSFTNYQPQRVEFSIASLNVLITK